MSTNKTPNYQLHSWTPDDDFRFHEVNENFTKLDTALKSEVNTLTTALAEKGELVVGTWSGPYTEKPVINLGKPIKALILENSEGWRGAYFDSRLGGGLILPGYPHRTNMVVITGTKFQINSMHQDRANWTYFYLAWVGNS